MREQSGSMQQFLVNLDQELAKLPRIEAELLKVEILDHLDASIQARLELGDTLAQAEFGALQAMGAANTFVPQMPEAKKPWIEWPAMAPIASGVSIIWLLNALPAPTPVIHELVLALLVSSFIAFTLYLGAKAKRIQIVGTAALYLLICGWIAIPDAVDVSTANIKFDFHEMLVRQPRAEHAVAAQSLKAQIIAFEEFCDAYRSAGSSPVSTRMTPLSSSVAGPVRKTDKAPTITGPLFTISDTHGQWSKTWSAAGIQPKYLVGQVEELNSIVGVYETAARRSWIYELPSAWWYATTERQIAQLSVLLVLFGLHTLGFFLGAFARWLKFRRTDSASPA